MSELIEACEQAILYIRGETNQDMYDCLEQLTAAILKAKQQQASS